MGEPLVSIVVPVYNVKKYLKKCVNSICEQSYTNLEIILVDDGSPDKSGLICDQLSQNDKRISVIHKINGGLSDARNAGIKEAHGQYISFIDSDDWVEKDTIKTAVENIISNNAELAIWGFSADVVDENEKLINSSVFSGEGLCKKDEYLMLEKTPFCAMRGYAWNKLFCLDIINSKNMYFPTGVSLVEDTVFNADYFTACKTLAFIDYAGTHYIQRSRETLGTRYYPNCLELKEMNTVANLKMLEAFGAPAEYLNEYKANADYISVQGFIRMIIKTENLSNDEKRKKLYNLMKAESTKQILRDYIPKDLKNRVYAWLIKHKQIALLIMIERNR